MVEVRKGTVSETDYIIVICSIPSLEQKKRDNVTTHNNAGLTQALGCGALQGRTRRLLIPRG